MVKLHILNMNGLKREQEMSLKITKTPTKIYLALSGGADSMFALHFFKQGRKDVTCLHFNHGTEESDKFEQFVVNQCEKYNVDLHIGRLGELPPKGCSKEKYWRDARYRFFYQFTDAPIITAHHLNDQIETALMGFCKGKKQRIRRATCENPAGVSFMRPFLGVDREAILSYNERHKVDYIQDTSNFDTSYPRNRIRNNVIPELMKAYPGLLTSWRNI